MSATPSHQAATSAVMYWSTPWTIERDAVIAKVRRRGEGEGVVNVARQSVPEAKREFGLKVVNLADMDMSVRIAEVWTVYGP